MTKFVKMSLAAAVAVAGFSSTASAKSLEDAIKGVDFSGYVRYRYTNTATEDKTSSPSDKASSTTSKYKIQTKLKVPVNDMVTATIATSNEATIDNNSKSAGDADPGVNGSDSMFKVRETYFTFNTSVATVMAGKQGLATPFADGSIDSQQGTGIVALIPAGPVTIAGGWYLSSDAQSIYNNGNTANTAVSLTGLKANNIGALAVIGKVSNVDYSLWYANIAEEQVIDNSAASAGADAFNINVAAKFGIVGVEVNYASVDYSLNSAARAALDELNPTQGRLVVSADLNPVTLKAGYITTDKDGGDVTLGDSDSSATYTFEDLEPARFADADIYFISASAKVADNVTVGAYYVDGEGYYDTVGTKVSSTDKKEDVSEFQVNAAYQMSKNFKVSAFYNMYEVSYDAGQNGTNSLSGDDSADKARVELKYTF